ncbi:hypothetical protein B0H16DRAFT_1477332 [Mycena metata]|uniref:Glucose-methanol-choline oxidoreductase N-terminal domain-containing protein n=1 Tax=Mycena metata TaxID=1033252 RepID=A0AAD7MFX4_9AGAR|nr:hypothetical protein B0H16DRAFT_1477332 [Mycena metata]
MSIDPHTQFMPPERKWTPPVDHHETLGQFDPTVYSATRINVNHVLAAAVQLSEDWPFSLNMNSGKPLKVHFEGVQFMQGKESHLYLNTVAYKKIGGTLFTANTTKEIVLSDGTVGTPTILMYSGIGDEATWANLGIATLLDLPSVGYNTTDQPLFGATGSLSTGGPAGSTGNFMSFGMVILNPVSLKKFWFGRNSSSGFLRPAGGRG